jgi:hypothetical protein
MEEMRKQWEAAQREREAQLTKEFEVNHLDVRTADTRWWRWQASRAEHQQQLEDRIRSREAASHANREAVETSMQKILEDSRKRFEQELARREEEFSKKKEEEVRRITWRERQLITTT